jgi:hypothetical protein
MGLFEWFRGRPNATRVDPVFGRLQHDGRSSWHGRARFAPLALEVSVVIVTGTAEPGERERSAFAELARRYEAMAPHIGTALLELYEPFLDAGGEGPRASSPDAMLRLTALDWVEIEAPDRLRLGYGFVSGAGWDDAMFTLTVTAWRVEGASLDD